MFSPDSRDVPYAFLKQQCISMLLSATLYCSYYFYQLQCTNFFPPVKLNYFQVPEVYNFIRTFAPSITKPHK